MALRSTKTLFVKTFVVKTKYISRSATLVTYRQPVLSHLTDTYGLFAVLRPAEMKKFGGRMATPAAGKR
jgi:hypothetical protein